MVWCIHQVWLMLFMFLAPNPPFSYPNLNGRLGMADFVRIYACAKLAASSDRQKIYDTSTQLKMVQSVLNTTLEPEAADSPYTPHMITLLAPLSQLPLINAYWTWLTASCLSGILAMYLILKRERRLDNWTTAIVILAAFGSINSMNVLLTGQTTWFLFLFYCLFFRSLSTKKEVAAGASYALATIKPQYAIPFAAGLIGARRWRALTAFTVATALMLILAGCVLGWHNVIDYPQLLSSKGGAEKAWYPEKMCNLRAILSNFMPYGLAYQYAFFALILSTPFACKLWADIKDSAEKLRWVFSLTVLLSLILGPHVNNYDCIMVALPAILTLPTVSPIEILRMQSKPLKIWCFLLIFYPSLGWTFGSNNYVFLPLNIALLVCGLIYLRAGNFSNQETGHKNR